MRRKVPTIASRPAPPPAAAIARSAKPPCGGTIIDTNLKQLLDGPLGKTVAQPWNRPPQNKRDHAVPGADIINDMQQTWVVWRAKKCDTAAMQYEEGTLSRVIYGACIYEETGRHALWLKSLVEDR